jgi:BirA family biotin operon repressor/biotin-[acetyl-CoA-carboxylase] ligase
VNSTNRLLLNWALGDCPFPADPLPEGTTVVATRQQQGRGQYGRTWHSAAGGLYLSLLLRPDIPLRNGFELTMALVWGVIASLRSNLPLDLNIKWPNDLVAQGQKLGGLLLQTRSSSPQAQVVVAGLGLNVNNSVPDMGISLSTLMHQPLDLTQVAAWVLQGLEQGYSIWQQSGLTSIQAEINSWLMYRQQVVQSSPWGAVKIEGITSSGSLQILSHQGIQTVNPGQFHLGYPHTDPDLATSTLYSQKSFGD